MKKTILFLFTFFSLSSFGQVQLGQSIIGTNFLERLGNVTMNDSGNRIAVGSNDSSNGYSSNGKVQVYELNTDTWVQIGENITGIQNNSNIGQSIDLSGDGNFVATGSVENVNNSFNGYVRVFQISSGNLVQVGQTIQGDNNEHFGTRVTLSKNGNILAVSSITETTLNKVKVFQNIAGTWTQIGQTIDGLVVGDDTGKKIELSEDGLTLLVISPDTRNNSNDLIGLARVFRFNGTSWLPLGTTFTGTYSFDIIKDASISEDGNIIAIASGNNVRTMQYNGTAWVARGSSFSLFNPFNIKLNNNGNTILFSNGSTSYSNSPAVYRFNFNGSTWKMNGAPLTIAASSCVPIFDSSANGEVMAMGNCFNNIVQETGIVKAYNYNNTTLGCQTAATLTANSGTIELGTIIGTIPTSGICYNYSQANPNANWWSFTPTQNGLLDITTITPQNATTVDTRLSIFTGTCAALTCFAGSDNVSTTDLRSNLNDLILLAGTTYYFVFDDKVSDNAAVNFFYEFTPQTCFRPNSVTFSTPTENTINVNWTAPTVGNTNPSSYTIQIGPRDYVVDSSAALQTIPTLVANSTTITGLTSNTVYDIYIKSNCSASDSSVWYGPFRSATEFTAVTPTYTENFDSDVSFLYVGWNRSGGTNSTLWRTYTGSTPFVNSGTRSIYSPIEPTLNTPTNTYAYTRKLNLTAGQSYTVSFMARQVLSSGTTTSRSLQVSYTSNSDYTNPATHNQIVNLTNTSDLGYFSENHNFTVSNSGQYRIAFRNAFQRTTGTGTAWLMLDSVVVSTALSVNSFSKSSMQLYPNPVLDNITIQNNDNLDIDNISIVDLNGRVVKEFKYTDLNNNLINISELEKGIYIINLTTSNQEVLSKKIIKE